MSPQCLTPRLHRCPRWRPADGGRGGRVARPHRTAAARPRPSRQREQPPAPAVRRRSDARRRRPGSRQVGDDDGPGPTPGPYAMVFGHRAASSRQHEDGRDPMSVTGTRVLQSWPCPVSRSSNVRFGRVPGVGHTCVRRV